MHPSAELAGQASGSGHHGFVVCVLTYGDHPYLVSRCLDSIVTNIDQRYVREIRVGMNAVSERVRMDVHSRLQKAARGTRALVYDSGVNRLKYPLMRKMFYDPAHPLLAPYLMWFDDDSCLRSDVRWWSRVHRQMEAADVLGSVYAMPARGGQADAVRHQPWYAGQPLPPGYSFKFATGGWWSARYEVLRRHDYPFKDIRHNGGDLALGEMLRQQRYRLIQFREGVWINADESGVESSAPRRGDRCKPVWYDFRPGERPDHSHHDFALEAVEIAATGDRC